MNRANRYSMIIERVFHLTYEEGDREVPFSRDDLISAASALRIELPKNIGDVVYSFRYRAELPSSITETAPPGKEWAIRPAGRSQYKFALIDQVGFYPAANLVETKILDATPGIIARYAQSDEQALLAILRYNRLVDIFTGLTCYSLQNHLRTSVTGLGQVEIDEVYVGVDRRGVHYVLPVQAKGGSERLGAIQVEQDAAACKEKFPGLICIPIGAQFMDNNLIALFSFELVDTGVAISAERHYRLVEIGELTEEELRLYETRVR